MRQDELESAAQHYAAALPIYREIRARLGEAGCLQSLGLLELAAGRAGGAFRGFISVLSIHKEISDSAGEQAALGYLARTAAGAGQAEQALVLAELSLAVGRRIRDRFGQTITLQLQIEIWLQARNFAPALAAMLLCRELRRAIRDPQAEQHSELLAQVLPTLPEEFRQVLEEQPEEVRAAGVAEAARRLKEAGREPFTPLD